MNFYNDKLLMKAPHVLYTLTDTNSNESTTADALVRQVVCKLYAGMMQGMIDRHCCCQKFKVQNNNTMRHDSGNFLQFFYHYGLATLHCRDKY